MRLAGGGYEAVFLPGVGMVGASLQYRGIELLSFRGGTKAFAEGHTTGLPLLAPWANRLSRRRYRAAGVDVDLRRMQLHTDENGLPIHGTMVGPFAWEVIRLQPARLSARYRYEHRPFPFAHELEIDARVSEDGLRVMTSLRPTGRRRVPASFGWHPYFKAERRARLRSPSCRHLELDSRGIPTGRSERQAAQDLRLADHALDDLYSLGRDRKFVLQRPSLNVEIRFGAAYPFAQLYAPPGKPFVAVEPMTAPTDALVTGSAHLVKPGECFRAVFSVSAMLL